MTREMEERIVAMYFDNADFEKNAKTTIETLGQLKSGLDISNSAKGFEIFDKLGKVLNFDKAQKGLSKIKTTLTGMTGIFKKVFNLGPLDEAASAVMNFKNHYLDRVLGFDLARTVANSLESAFRGLTIQPVTAGWTQYQNKMDSVKTIMSSTGESIDTVETHLQSLTEYANKTIYSLSDMTSNLGKFTNNGMKLKDSVLAMQGIANAAADAGQGAQQASMAMYNFSQAMGVGKMTTIDWKSIENANMATTRLKDTFIEMAAAQGELHKEFSETDKKYHYYITKNSKGQAEKDRKKWTEVTAKNFRETLSKDWLTAEAMMHALMVYSGEALDPDTIKSWGITDPKMIKDLEEIGKNALEAATQVRTFSKMMDAAKEAAQSGWADSFELIFGNMEQGTTLWTEINKVLDEVLSKSAETRNSILRVWAGSSESTKEEEEELTSKTDTLNALKEHLEQLKKEGDVEGTTAEINELTASIQKYRDEIAELRKNKTKDNAESTQAQIDRRLKKITELENKVKDLEKRNQKNKTNQKKQDRITELEDQIKAYEAEIQSLNHANEIDSETNADVSVKRQKQITEKEQKMAQLQKELDKLRKETGTDEIEDTRKQIEALEKEIEQLNVAIDEKNSKQKSEFVDEQGRSGRDILFDRETGALFQLIDLAREFGTTVSEAFGAAFGVLDAEKLFNITKDFGNAVKTVVEWFGKANVEGSRMSKIKKGLQGIFAILKTVFNFVKIGWNLVKKIISPVANFFVEIFGKFGDFFGNLGELKPVEVFQKLGEGLQKTWEKVKKFFTPQEIKDASGKGTGVKEIPVITWIKDVWNGLKNTVREWADENGLGDIYTNVTTWWHNLTTSIDEAFAEIKKWWEGSPISGFFNDMWNGVVGAFTGEEIGVDEAGNKIYGDSPIVKFFKDIGTNIDTAFNDVNTWWNDSKIPDFFRGLYEEISGIFKPKERYDERGIKLYDQRSPVEKWFADIWDSIKTVWEEISTWGFWTDVATFGQNTWAWITSHFKPKERYDERGIKLYDQRSPVEEWLTNIWEGLKSTWDEIVNWSFWADVATFGQNTWTWITSFFKPKERYDERGIKLYDQRSPVEEWLTNIWEGLKSTWDEIIHWSFWTDVATFGQNTWTWITSFFKPKERYDERGIKLYDQRSPVEEWLTNIWEGLKSTWNTIVSWEGWGAIGEFLSNTWGWITDLFSGSANSVAGASETAVDAAGKVAEAANKTNLTPEETEEGLNFFQRIMTTIGDFISQVVESVQGVVIPPEITTFITQIGDFLKGILKVIGDVLGSWGELLQGKTDKMDLGDWLDVVLSAFGAIAIIFLNLKAAKWTSQLSSVNNIGTQFLMFAGGVLMIASAVALLTTVNPNQLGAAFGVVEAIAVTIGGFITAIAKITAGKEAITTTSTERIFSKLIDKVSSIAMIAIIMKEIPPIIKAISEAKQKGSENVGDELLKMVESVALLFSAVTVCMAVVNKISGNQGISPTATLKTLSSFIILFAGISAVVLAVGGLGEAVDGIFGENSHEAVIGALNKAAEFFQGVGNAIGGFIMGLFGIKSDKAKTMEALDIADMLTEASEAFNSEKISGISRMMSLITSLSSDTTKINTGRMAEFAEAMGNLGEGIYALASYVAEVEGPLSEMHDPNSLQYQKLEGVIGFVARIGQAFSSYAPFMETSSYKLNGFTGIVERLKELVKDENLNSLTESLSKMMTKFSTDLPNGDTIQFDGVAIVGKLYDAIQLGLNSNADLPMFDATSIIDDIMAALQLGDESIAQVVHDMVQNGLNLSGSKGSKYELPSGTVEVEPGENTKPFIDLGSLGNLLNTDSADYEKTLKDLEDSMKDFNLNVPNINATLDTNGWSSLFNFEGGENGEDSVLAELQAQMTALNEAVNELPDKFTITITPVFDMTNMTPEKLQAAFNNQFATKPLLANVAVNNPASSIDFSSLKSDLGIDQIDFKLASLLTALSVADRNNYAAIEDLRQNMNGISNAIAGMRLMLDTGVLVGQITPMVDYELGRRSALFGRTGVVFGKK